MWTKAEVGGGTLSLIDAFGFRGWDNYNPDCQCDQDPLNTLDIVKGKLEFWLSDCYTPVVTFHDFDHLSSRHSGSTFGTHTLQKADRGWSNIAYSITGLGDGSYVDLFLNGYHVHSEHINIVIYKAIGDGFQSSIGSFHGQAYFLQGFIFDFKYAQKSYADTDDNELLSSSL